MELVAWTPGMRIGGGYDVVRGEEKQEAVTGEVEKPINAAGQQGNTSFTLATSSDEVDKALSIDASIKIGVGPFGGSAKMNFHEQCKVSNEATFCIVSAYATNAFEQLVRPALSAEATELLSGGKKDRFRERFGDCFVSGQFSGVEFYAVVRIEASKRDRQMEIASEVQASYGMMASGEAKVNFKEKMSSESHRIEINVFQTGGEVAVCESVEQMISLAKQTLADGRNGKAYPFQVTLDPFKELKLPNDDASLIDTEMAEKSVKMALSYITDMRRILNDIDYVRRNPGWYENPNLTELNTAAASVTKEINRLWDAANTCSRHFDQCVMTVPEFPVFTMPKRKADAPAPVPAPQGQGLGGRRFIDVKHLNLHKELRGAALQNVKMAQLVKQKLKP